MSTDSYVRHDGGVTLDDRDRAIVDGRMQQFNARSNERPAEGEWVIFQDGSFARISYVWPEGAQTSTGGSYYLGEGGYCSMSGGLDPSIPFTEFRLTEGTKNGWVWIFHHDYRTAHNSIDVSVPFRVWRCSRENGRAR